MPTNRFTEISVECLQEVEIMTAWWVAQLCAGRCDSFPVILSLISRTKCVSIPRNRMGEFRKYGSVGGAPGNRCFYPARAKISPGRWERTRVREIRYC